MKKTEKFIRLIIEVSGIAGVVTLLAMMMMTVVDVIMRYFFLRPIIGSVEISIALMVCVVFLGIAWCALNDGHIRVDIITGRLSKRGQALLDGFDNLATLMLALIITWRSFLEAVSVKKMEVTSPLLGIPRYPFVLITAFGFLLLFFAALILFLRNVKSVKDKNETG
ncbi:MAG: TRAP transporter small permease [Deltaproteobacteria bacterium]|nr:TRAP transporter small permease [Deltaproteobacteria bacterium]